MSEIQSALTDLKGSWKTEYNRLKQAKRDHQNTKFNWPVFIGISVVLFFFLGPGSIIAAFLALKIMELLKNKNQPALVTIASQSSSVEKICSLSEDVFKGLSPAKKFAAISILKKSKATLINKKKRLEVVEKSEALGQRASEALKEIAAGISATDTLSGFLESDLQRIAHSNEEKLEVELRSADYLNFRRLLDDDLHMQEALASGLISKEERMAYLQDLSSARAAYCCDIKGCDLPKHDGRRFCVIHVCMEDGCTSSAMKYNTESRLESRAISLTLSAAKSFGYHFSVKPHDLEAHICSEHYQKALNYLCPVGPDMSWKRL